MIWNILEHCGNSPKNKMLVDWIVAFVDQEGDFPFITEDSVIVYKGDTTPLNQFDVPAGINSLHLKQSITHGRIGSVLGEAVVGDNHYPFALFFEFSLGKQAKIKRVECIIDRF